MMDTLVKLLPALGGIAAGYVLRRRGIADDRDGDFMFALIINVFLPALAFTSLSRARIDEQLAVFPLAALFIVSVGHLSARLVARRGPFIGTQAVVLVCCCMNVNTGFILPFVQGLFGADGVARIAAFDAVNTTLTFTWTAYVAARGNPRYVPGPRTMMLRRFVTSPPLYGIAAGLSVSATRVGSGLAVAVAFVLVFGLTGADRTVMLLMGVAPTPFFVVAFATMENLDVRLAVNVLSLSMLASLPMALAVILLTT
jgi:predicted permease